MVDAIVYDLLKQLASITTQQAKEEIKLIVGVDQEVQELKDKLGIIQAVLDDAEEGQVKQHVVKHWLAQLKDAYYEMDDVLDSWNTAMIKSEIEKEEGKSADSNATPAVKQKKVCSFLPSPSCCFRQASNLALRHDIGHKIKKLNETLDKIVKDKLFGFDLTWQLEVVPVDRPKTTSFVDASNIIGRDNNKANLLSSLLDTGSQEERKPRVISLVGMGGLGKTTLAQLAYNDPRVKAHFEQRMWVCVSDPFDQCRVAKDIIESIEHQSPNINQLQSLLDKICDLIGGKKFFLVLDDVWTEEYKMWEPFKLVFENGAHESRILVTTRKQGVAKMMASAPINLEVLSEEDCWLIFSKIAFSNEDQREELEDLGRQLAMKCKGLPLAVKTLGSLMHNKTSREQWKNILASSLWELEDVERGVFAPLLLSYYDLPSPMKRCFSYCATFPKDYKFYINELVVLWMAQGYIDSKANMEMKAEEYFEVLAMRSFFQDFEKNKYDGRIVSCKMHDIVHDFAQSMTKNECFIIDGDKESKIDLKSARHLHLKISEESKFPESVYEAKNLHTLFLTSGQQDHCFDMLLSNLFKRFRYLRTLYLDCRIKKLPDTVENLIHLRCLLMSERVEIEELPETMCNLCNLQSLRFNSGDLKKLPHGMGKLINLRYLNISAYDPNWDYGVYPNPVLYRGDVIFPKGIGKLTCLKTLRDFYICGKDEREECKVGELKNLDELRVLGINGLRNVVDVSEAENAQLKKKIYLRHLVLQFGDILDLTDERGVTNDVLTLNALEPHPDLEILGILGHLGTTVYPNWMMSLTELKILILTAFPKLESLPPLGKLPSLEKLHISFTWSLKKVGVEFLGIESNNKKDDIIFPRLKSLLFQSLYNLEEWIGFEGMREEEDNGITIIMPRLQLLQIENCGNLKSLPDFLRTTPLLKELNIGWCPILSKRCEREIGEEWPKISHIPNIEIDRMYVQRDIQREEEEEDGYTSSD